MKIEDITAEVVRRGVRPDPMAVEYVQVKVDLGDDREVVFTIHQSKSHKDCINVEIDGDLVADDPTLRMHLNDNLIFDSILDRPAITPDREPDLEMET